MSIEAILEAAAEALDIPVEAIVLNDSECTG